MRDTKTFELDNIKGELLVTYSKDMQPPRLEECHGTHYFDDSSVEIESVEIVIGSKGIDITKLLDENQLKTISKEL